MNASPAFTHWLATRTAPVWGSWLMAATPTTAEALACAGFDFLVIDLEHVPIDTPQAIELLRAIGTTTQPIVRLAANDPVLIKKALDIGAQTLMLPFIQSAEDAHAAARASLYPPQGQRGVAAMHRASRYGTDPAYFASANQGRTLIAQIETVEAATQLEAIAAVDGIDALFVGPGDLAASLGYIGNIAAAPVQALLQELAQRSRAAGLPCGTVAPNPALAQRCLEYGYDFVAIASDLGFMMGAARNALETLRKNLE